MAEEKKARLTDDSSKKLKKIMNICFELDIDSLNQVEFAASILLAREKQIKSSRKESVLM